MIPSDEPPIKREDSTPPIVDQAKSKGWDAGIYSFGKGESDNITFFNPGLVERPDGLWLLARVSEINENWIGMNSVYAFMLDESGKVPKVGYRLNWPDSQGSEQHEDARAVYFPKLDQTCVLCCNFAWYGSDQEPNWSGALQTLGFFDSEWDCKIKHRPPIGGNPREFQNINRQQYEKSWLPFFHEDKLHILYSAKPWRIYEFDETWEEGKLHEDKQGVSWSLGTIRNGTPPVLIEDTYYTFFHSSLPWKGNYRRYYAGLITFESKPPFRPIAITKEPLLIGSQNDKWSLRKPPCIFPCGAIYRDNKFFITSGVNDLQCAWTEIPLDLLLPLLSPITTGVTPIFSKSGLSEQEKKKEKQRQNAARAREALRIKREKGLIPVPRARKKNVRTKAGVK